MKELIKYVLDHTVQGPCSCGKCDSAPEKEEKPKGHTINMYYFDVSVKNDPDKETLKKLISENHKGDFADMDLLDGVERSYLDIGRWIGDQGIGMLLMALGRILGLWDVMTPNSLPLPKEMKDRMAGAGMISILGKSDTLMLNQIGKDLE